MNTDLKNNSWQIAAKIVLYEMHQRLINAENEMHYNRSVNPNYSNSSQETCDQAEVDMYKEAVKVLEAILL